MGSIDFLRQLEKDGDHEFPTFYQGQNDLAILFLHGFGSSPEESGVFLKYLASKGYTISAPIIKNCSQNHDLKEINEASPEDWLIEAKKQYQTLAEHPEIKKIAIIGLSFGGNLAISLAAEDPAKLAGIVTLETPVFFSRKISLGLRFIRPLLLLFKIQFINKTSRLYRKGYKESKMKDVIPLIPLKVVGKIFKFVNQRTKVDIKKLKQAFLGVQAEKSDLVNPKSVEYLYRQAPSLSKNVFYLSVNNHDLSLLDEQGKILMMERVEKFIESL